MNIRRFVVLLALLWTVTAQASRDFTFFLFSDIHVGAENLKVNPPMTREQSVARVKANLDVMRELVGKPSPEGPVAAPRGLFILGDLTDGHKELDRNLEQWRDFETLFPAAGVVFGERKVPVFAIAGNHDGPVDGPQRQGLVKRNRTLEQLSALSSNGVHYALNWDGVHFIFLGLCPADTTDTETPFKFGKPGAGSWNDPQGALSFLKDYLARRVGVSREPVVLLFHYGFDGFSLNDWNWWTLKQRRALYELLEGYNVVALFHGHNHHAEHYRWPDPKRHAADLNYFFDGKPPTNPRSYSVISCTPLGWVIRVQGDKLIATHRNSRGWNKDTVVKTLTP